MFWKGEFEGWICTVGLILSALTIRISFSSLQLMHYCVCLRTLQKIIVTFIDAFGSNRGFFWLKPVEPRGAVNIACSKASSTRETFHQSSFPLSTDDISALIVWLGSCAAIKSMRIKPKDNVRCLICNALSWGMVAKFSKVKKKYWWK